MNIKDIHERIRRGEPVNDEELAALIETLEKLGEELVELNYDPYHLVYVDTSTTLAACVSYKRAR